MTGFLFFNTAFFSPSPQRKCSPSKKRTIEADHNQVTEKKGEMTEPNKNGQGNKPDLTRPVAAWLVSWDVSKKSKSK